MRNINEYFVFISVFLRVKNLVVDFFPLNMHFDILELIATEKVYSTAKKLKNKIQLIN